MPALNSCARCGAELRPQNSEGFCTRCLLQNGLEESQAEAKIPGLDQAQTLVTESEHRTSNVEHRAVRNFGDYELLEEIARGGMGVVYRARQLSLGRIVAVKMILAGPFASKQIIQRFRGEVTAAALLQHPNIVAIHDVGIHDDQHYFSMDYVEGQNLSQLVGNRPLPPAKAARYVKLIAEAIHYAHQQGILHRDLKPSNVLIDSATDQPRVTDFGLAKRLEAETELTLSGQLLGSPNYMSPEQAAAKRGAVGKRSDVYSLGAILYHLLTGRAPFQGEILTDVLHQVVNNDPLAPHLLAPRVPRDLETVCLKCLEKEPAKRYAIAQELADEFGRFLTDEPIQARPVMRAERVWRWCRRKPALAGALAAAAAMLLIVVIGAPIETYRINRLRRRAVQGELAARQGEYASHMNLAQQKLSMNNLGQAVRLLDRYRPNTNSEIRNAKSEIDLRGWEWRYLWQQCQSDALFTLSNTGALRSLAVSHDGKWLAVGEGKYVSLLDLRTRKEIERLPASSIGFFTVKVAFSPIEPLLAFSVASTNSAKIQYSVRLWDGAVRKHLAIELTLGSRCGRLSFSGNGQTLVTCTEGPNGELALWRVRDGEKLSSYPAADVNSQENGAVFAVASDLSVAAYATRPPGANNIHLIDLVAEKERWSKPAAEEEVLGLALSSDGKILASGAGYAESAIRLWDVASGMEIGRLVGHGSFVQALAFWPDGKTLASASGDQTIRLWDVSDAAHPRALQMLRGHLDEVFNLVLLPDNKTLVSNCKDGSISVWDTTMGKRVRPDVKLPATLATWRFPDSRSVLTLDQSGQVARWSGAEFDVKESLIDIGKDLFPSEGNWSMWPALISQDGRMLAVGSTNGILRVWDLQNRRLLSELTASIDDPIPWAFLGEGKKLVISGADDFLDEFDPTTGKKTGSWPGHKHMMSLSFSPDEQWCLMSTPGLLRNMATGRETRLTNQDNSGAMNATFSPDGRLFAVSSWDGRARLWETATLRLVDVLGGVLQGMHSVAFSPDGQRLATGSNGKEAIKLWSVENRQELLTLEGQGSMFGSSAFSPDGNLLGSMNASGLLHLWRAPSWADIEATEARQKIEAQQP